MTPPKFFAPYLSWWQGLLPRERQIVAIGGALLLFFILYLAFWAPMQHQLTRLRVTVPQDTIKLARMRAQAQQVQQLRMRLPAETARGSLLSVLEQSASNHGLRQQIGRIEPEGQTGARVFMEEVSFDTLLEWIAELQNQGIRAENITIQRRPAAGFVNVRILLRAPS